MLSGKCNVVPAAVGIKIKVGTKGILLIISHHFRLPSSIHEQRG